MAQVALNVIEAAPLPMPKPAAGGAFDRVHLASVTFGDRSLERELLELFDRQIVLLSERMRGAEAAAVAALAHTLKGSAAGVGAFGVADAAAVLEKAATMDRRREAMDALAQSATAARAEIARMLAG